VAALVAPANDDDLESLLLALSPRFRGPLTKSRASIEAGKDFHQRPFGKL
jgi:hypothetical protein